MNNFKFRFMPLLLIAAALALAVGGCGDNDSETASSSANTEEAAMKAKEDAAMKAKESEAMKAKEDAAMKAKEEKAMKADGAKIKASSVGQYGEILQDKRGRSIYIFTKEKTSKSECYDECAEAWPPVLTKGDPVAGSGATQSKLGTTKRTDGKTQVTYGGQPLYFYVGETKADQVLCQAVPEFGGIWYIVAPSGKPITQS